MAEEAQVNLAEVAAYQGMKIGQLADRLGQLEMMFMQFSKTANQNQQKFIEELGRLRMEVEALKQPLGNSAEQIEIFDGEVARGAVVGSGTAESPSMPV